MLGYQAAGRIRMPCDHCWHDTGAMMLIHTPPQKLERCCHCGKYQNRMQTTWGPGKIHGPYVAGWRNQVELPTMPQSRSGD